MGHGIYHGKGDGIVHTSGHSNVNGNGNGCGYGQVHGNGHIHDHSTVTACKFLSRLYNSNVIFTLRL